MHAVASPQSRLAIAVLVLGLLKVAVAAHAAEVVKMDAPGIEEDRYGTTADGDAVDRYTLRNAHGMMLRLINYGATITELHVPDRNGRQADVVLGFDRLEDYESPMNPYFGATVGRVAFRITEGQFTLDGKQYRLPINRPPHHLHGGPTGLSRVVWQAKPVAGPDPAVQFSVVRPDGDQGYPGTLHASVTYTLTPQNELRIEYEATADRPTPVNFTNHCYFNLAGVGAGDVLGHVLRLNASRRPLLDDKNIPSGKIGSVEGTPFDFRQPTPIGARMERGSEAADGYDLGFLIDRPEGDASLVHAATLSDPGSGRVLDVLTTQPGIVFYTGNYLDGSLRGKAAAFGKHSGVCLETAHLPDSPNRPEYPSVILRPGQTYRHTCVLRFRA